MDSFGGGYAELQKKLEHLERYSRDYNIRVIGVDGENGEDCMAIVLNYVNLLGLEDATGEVENAHRTRRREDNRIISLPNYIAGLSRERYFRLPRVSTEKKL